MKKELLDTFIRSYYLGNLIPKVKWKYNVTDKTLHVRAVADSRSFIADVVMSDFADLGTEDVVLCIADTKKIKAMMTPFGDDINISINKTGDRVLGFTISDADCESYCTAADPSAMEPVPKNLQDMSDYHVVVPLTEELLERFLKARGALDDVETFSVGMNKKGLFEIVIGYTTANSNRIRMTPACLPDKNKIDQALSFPLKNVAEVLKANGHIPDGNLAINSNGIIRIQFKDKRYSCTYYQFSNKKS